MGELACPRVSRDSGGSGGGSRCKEESLRSVEAGNKCKDFRVKPAMGWDSLIISLILTH